MKKKIILLTIVLSFFNCTRNEVNNEDFQDSPELENFEGLENEITYEVNYNDLQDRNGVKYEINQSTPFTGLAKFYFPNGEVKALFNYVNGINEGPQKVYYETGQVKISSNYTNGLQEGLAHFYYENGQLRLEAYYKNNLQDGLSKAYYRNGQPSIESIWKEGKQDSIIIEYNENGEIIK